MEQEENVECVLGEQKTNCTMHRRQRNTAHRCNRKNDNVIVVASFIVTLVVLQLSCGNAAVDALPSKDVQPLVRINKCCEKFEILVDEKCTAAKESNNSELKEFSR